eukprot:4406065-Pyramimonas_sp.AAC.1
MRRLSLTSNQQRVPPRVRARALRVLDSEIARSCAGASPRNAGLTRRGRTREVAASRTIASWRQ